MSNLLRLSKHTTAEVFEFFDYSSYAAKFFNADVRNARITNFRKHGITCVRCGLHGSFFAREKYPKDNNPHLNLYAIDAGKDVLMTKDHIKPRSLGGVECLHNIWPMCSRCNASKGNRYGWADKAAHLISLLAHKAAGQCKCSIIF